MMPQNNITQINNKTQKPTDIIINNNLTTPSHNTYHKNSPPTPNKTPTNSTNKKTPQYKTSPKYTKKNSNLHPIIPLNNIHTHTQITTKTTKTTDTQNTF